MPDEPAKQGEMVRLRQDIRSELYQPTKRFIGLRWTAELAAKARLLYPYQLVAGPHQRVGGHVVGLDGAHGDQHVVGSRSVVEGGDPLPQLGDRAAILANRHVADSQR